jgi:hypothetical protein
MTVQPPAESNGEQTFEAVLDFAVAEGEDFEVIITPKAGTRVVRMDTATTRALRDLVGATFDMKRVAELCKEYVAAIENDSPQVVQDALWMTAVVLYARCFNGGVRQPLKTTVLDSVPGQAREAHGHFIDLRDKFVAHSVSVYEQTLPYVVVGLEKGDVLSTGTTHLWANPMNEQGAKTLEGLAWAFYNWGMEQRAVVGMLVRMEAEALDSASLARLPDLAVDTPSVEKGHRRRKP